MMLIFSSSLPANFVNYRVTDFINILVPLVTFTFFVWKCELVEEFEIGIKIQYSNTRKYTQNFQTPNENAKIFLFKFSQFYNLPHIADKR